MAAPYLPLPILRSSRTTALLSSSSHVSRWSSRLTRSPLHSLYRDHDEPSPRRFPLRACALIHASLGNAHDQQAAVFDLASTRRSGSSGDRDGTNFSSHVSNATPTKPPMQYDWYTPQLSALPHHHSHNRWHGKTISPGLSSADPPISKPSGQVFKRRPRLGHVHRCSWTSSPR